ncbi:hypothetical protein BHE74_00006222 [Ensete ventricosum]|nr:hypothetical protein GW17_00045420 [Ensete ventricosum]RWW85128.1 hypothetical protein BHE74_00006222 [Ensete ventricosum]
MVDKSAGRAVGPAGPTPPSQMNYTVTWRPRRRRPFQLSETDSTHPFHRVITRVEGVRAYKFVSPRSRPPPLLVSHPLHDHYRYFPSPVFLSVPNRFPFRITGPPMPSLSLRPSPHINTLSRNSTVTKWTLLRIWRR